MGRNGAGRVGRVFLVLVGGGAGASGPAAWIGTPEALRTGVTGDEVTRAGIAREALAEDAALGYLDATTACFDVTVRSLEPDDAPLANVAARCTAGEASAPAVLHSTPMVSVYDYDARGSIEQTVVDHTTSDAYEHEHRRPAAEGVRRVVERSARFCCDVAVSGPLDLSLGSPPRAVTLHWDVR